MAEIQPIRPLRLDLVSPIVQGQRVAQQRAGFRAQVEDRRRRDAARALAGRVLNGDPDAMRQLQQVAPEAALQLQQQQRSAAGERLALGASQMQLSEARREQAVRRIDRASRMIDFVRRSPASYAAIRRSAIAEGLLPEQRLPAELPADAELREQRLSAFACP